MQCEKNNIEIKNYDGLGIEYFWQNKKRKYYPDFVLNSNMIVEVKGKGLFYWKTFHKTESKRVSLEKWCTENDFSCKMVFEKDIESSLRKEAKKIHDKTNKKDEDSICGQST